MTLAARADSSERFEGGSRGFSTFQEGDMSVLHRRVLETNDETGLPPGSQVATICHKKNYPTTVLPTPL